MKRKAKFSKKMRYLAIVNIVYDESVGPKLSLCSFEPGVVNILSLKDSLLKDPF